MGGSLALAMVGMVALCLALDLPIDRGLAKLLMMMLFVGFYSLSRMLWRPIRARNHLPELLAAVGLR